MSYTLNYSNDTKKSLIILPNSVNDSLPLTFYGYNHSNYGQGLWTDLLHLLENYASDGTTLLNPIEGMLWYNNVNKVLNIYKTTGWTEIIDLERFQATYGSDINDLLSKIIDELKKSPPSDNIKKFIAALSKLFVPLIGGTLTGNLYLPDEIYANYKTLPNNTQKVITNGFLEWFVDDYITHYQKPLSAGFDDGGFGIGFDDGVINAASAGDFLPLNVEEVTFISGQTLNISSDLAFAQVFVPTSVSANCAINKEYADSLLTETSLFSKIDNTTDFISAIDNLAIYPDASPDTSNEVNVSEVLSYMSIYDKSEQSTAPSTTVYTTPLSIQITPASINSKFYINVALLLSNGTTPGASICGLYKNGNALIEKFSIIDRGTDADLIASCTTFIDAPNDVAPVTYDVRIYNELSTGKWYINKSADGTKSGVSYMTILEYQDTNFVNNTATYVPPVIKVPFVKASIEYKIPNPTNEYYEYTVPDGVTKISVDIVGAGGGAGGWDGVAAKLGGNGGNGIKMSATITVIPQEVLRIYVGCGGVGGGTTNNDFKTKQKSIFRNPNDSILPIIVDKTSLLASTVFPSAGATNNGWVKFLSNNNVWNSTLGNKIDNVNFYVTFPRTAPYIVSCSIDNYGYIKIDDTLIVDVPGQKNVFSKCTPLLKGVHTITAYGYNTDGPMGFALDIRESSSGFNNGGAGGTSGPIAYSGEGGYGGGSSAIVKADGTVLLVAAGGGGGGGGDKNGIASGLSINGIKTPTTGTITYTDNGDGKTPGTGIDGGGGGGGGGGYSADSKGLGLGGNFGTANASGVGGSEGKSYINTDYVTLTYTIYPTAKGTPGYGGITKNSTSYVASTIGINEDGQCGYVKITTVEA